MVVDERRVSTRRTRQESTERRTETGKRTRVTKNKDFSSISYGSGIVLPEVKKVLAERKREKQPIHRTSIIFPSEMAKTTWCPRATYFRMSGVPDPASKPSFTLENVFAEGNAVHSKWQGWLSETGKLWGDWRCSRCA